ncbi:MAG: sugar phosphate nucleotidyltransferase [Thermoanaerobaculales bacterium]|nr:sugar phosphate nucleotidyltransferase [Thermoanaerobaculales bacterium]
MILAAGEGKRVRQLTRDRWGQPAPKQYALIDGRRTLLDVTSVRATKIASPERIVTVVASQHRRWWASDPAQLPPGHVIVQPENRGTAAGILLPLLWIIRRDPEARLVILPSDHAVASETTLHQAITGAISHVPRADSKMILLGVQAEAPETGYGWIVPRQGKAGGLRTIAAFHEKPDAETTASLFAQGGLLNSFILISGGRFLRDLFKTAMPVLWHAFQPIIQAHRGDRSIEQDASHAYGAIPMLDFSKDLLERVADTLSVYPVPACGWLDLGTPERLTSHFAGQQHAHWLSPNPLTDRGSLPEVHPSSLEITRMTGGQTTNTVV